MENTQKICCSVKSCKYNTMGKHCKLAKIQVSPDESMCSSYEYGK